jgi:hypothetical protein
MPYTASVRTVAETLAEHTVWLLIVYRKAQFDNLPAEFLAELRLGVEDALRS